MQSYLKIIYGIAILTSCVNKNSEKDSASAPTNTPVANSSHTIPPSANQTQTANKELADDVKIYNLANAVNFNSNLNFVLNSDIKQSISVVFQNGQWTSNPDYSKDYCRLGGAGANIDEKLGTVDYVVFIKSVSEDAKSIRIGLPGIKIKTFVLVECELTNILKEQMTYGQLKSLTGNFFKFVSP